MGSPYLRIGLLGHLGGCEALRTQLGRSVSRCALLRTEPHGPPFPTERLTIIVLVISCIWTYLH